MLSFSKKEIALFRKLNNPIKVQDFLNSIPFNHESNGVGTAKSPAMVLSKNNAHCIEGAMLGAYILSLHGFDPLLLHLKSTKEDFEHVIAPFCVNGLWGALSKTNHAVLRYRDPLYKDIHELVMSYFHEYAINDGTKTLRSYSDVLNLRDFGSEWLLEESDLWGIDEELGKIKHYDIVPKGLKLRKSDPIERSYGLITEWKKYKRKS